MARVSASSCISAIFAHCLLAFLALPAHGQLARGDQAFLEAFGPCGETCVIKFSSGGELKVFRAAAEAVRAGAKQLVVIDGPCLSACAVFADLARAKVCITERARFGFHKAKLLLVRGARELDRIDPPHSADIAEWVQRNGGFPSKGARVMNARQATQFWSPCRVLD